MTIPPPSAVAPFTTDDYAARMARAVADAGSSGLDGLLVAPGPDLAWLTGYRPSITERLTMLVLTEDREPTLLVPTESDKGLEEGHVEALVAWVEGGFEPR